MRVRHVIAVAAAMALGAGTMTVPGHTSAHAAGPQDAAPIAARTATPIAAPNVEVHSASATSVKLEWKAVPGAASYQVFRQSGKGTLRHVATLSAATRSWRDAKLSMKVTYAYKVRAIAADGTASPFGPVVKKIAVKGRYSTPSLYGAKLTKKELAKLRNEVADIVNQVQIFSYPHEDRVDFSLWFFKEYVKSQKRPTSKHSDTAYGAILRGRATNAGHTRGYLALCDAMGGVCKPIHSKVNSKQWIHQKVQGSWWIIDPQRKKVVGKVKPSVSVKKAKAARNPYLSYYVMKR